MRRLRRSCGLILGMQTVWVEMLDDIV
jgi:hypothetical protein